MCGASRNLQPIIKRIEMMVMIIQKKINSEKKKYKKFVYPVQLKQPSYSM
jgi:hypothetical protein